MLLAFCCCCCVAGAAAIDHPHRFDPAKYPDRAAWERRRDFLRHQVLVAQGLWPMPEKTPLAPVVHGLVVRKQLMEIFRFRRRVIAQELGWVRALQDDVVINRL